MTEYIRYIYDAGAVLILAAGVTAGYRRGVLRTVLAVICTLVAMLAAHFLSSPDISANIYDKYFSAKVEENIDKAVKKAEEEVMKNIAGKVEETAELIIDEHFGGAGELKSAVSEYLNGGREEYKQQIAEIYTYMGIDLRSLLTNPAISGKIDSIASEYSSTAAEEINRRLPLGLKVEQSTVKKVISDTNVLESLIYDFFGIKPEYSDMPGAADYIEKNVVRPAALKLISTVMWAAVFTAVNIFLRIITEIILMIRNIRAVKVCDSALGGVLGAVSGAAVIAALTAVIVMLVQVTGGMTYMNEEIFSSCFIFGKIYGLLKNISFF